MADFDDHFGRARYDHKRQADRQHRHCTHKFSHLFFPFNELVDPEKLIFCQGFGKNLFFEKIEAKEKFGVKSQPLS
jgi:hypothetical protein